jgi:hypothetical protein
MLNFPTIQRDRMKNGEIKGSTENRENVSWYTVNLNTWRCCNAVSRKTEVAKSVKSSLAWGGGAYLCLLVFSVKRVTAGLHTPTNSEESDGYTSTTIQDC